MITSFFKDLSGCGSSSLPSFGLLLSREQLEGTSCLRLLWNGFTDESLTKTGDVTSGIKSCGPIAKPLSISMTRKLRNLISSSFCYICDNIPRYVSMIHLI